MAQMIDRRSFVHASLLSAGALSYWPRIALGQERRIVAQPFELSQVRLRPGAALDAMNVNRRHLLAYDPDRLLHTFRLTAGLPSTAEPLGGWEAPNNELRGHFTGHYLSACALSFAHADDKEMKARGDTLVAELAKCQAALGNGYLSAFPEEAFDRLRTGKQVWAPFYTLHKIMAGMLDMHVLAGNAQARDVLERIAAWVALWVRPIDTALMERILEREYGGMNEVLYNFAALTGQDRWRELAERFNRTRVFEPLAAGRDELQGLHVNTTIPQVIGAARGHELTGDRHLHDCADFFWHTVTERRSYCTGGTSNGESWNAPPGKLAAELSGYTQECCVTYNMQKLTRHIFGWTADARAADYYERAYYNGILGVQHPRDGNKLYYVPLQSGFWKMFGTPLHDFWCCTGSMAESFAKLGDSIYFKDDDGLYVNLFVPSEVTWKEKGLRIVQDTTFPESDRVTFVVHAAQPKRAQLRIRVPSWTVGGSASLNGAKPRELRDAGQLLRARSHVAPGRSRGGALADATAHRADARRCDGAGRDVRTDRVGRQARRRRSYGGESARRTDQAAHGSGVQVGAGRRSSHPCSFGRSGQLAQALGSARVPHVRTGERPHAGAAEPHLRRALRRLLETFGVERASFRSSLKGEPD